MTHTRKIAMDKGTRGLTPISLLDVLPKIANTMHASGHVELFCDFDGVLAAIAPRPQDAHLDKRMRNTLRQLPPPNRCHLSVISGRTLADVRARTGISGITYAGIHGLDIDGPGIQRVHPIPEHTMDTVRALLEELHTALSACPGIIVEDKGPVTAVHIRLIEKARIPSIRKRFSSLVAKHNAGNLLRVTQGKEVMEVWPMVAWDKGRAVEWLLQERHGINWESHVTAIYLGDDKTDEDVFRLLHDRGITVRVGQEALHATAARFVLRSTDEVRMFFDWLAHTLH